VVRYMSIPSVREILVLNSKAELLRRECAMDAADARAGRRSDAGEYRLHRTACRVLPHCQLTHQR
jgi:hypothetical protein